MKDKTLSSNYSFKGTIWLFMLVLSSFMYVANAQQKMYRAWLPIQMVNLLSVPVLL